MNSENYIKMNYDKTLQEAQELEDLADKLEKLANIELNESLSKVANDWRGESAGKFLRKEEQIKSDTKQTATSIRAVAEDIRTIAKLVHDAEMRAYRIAEERKAIE